MEGPPAASALDEPSPTRARHLELELPYARVVSVHADPLLEAASTVPRGPLAPFVAREIGYRMNGFEPGVHVGLPSTSLTFILSFDQPLELSVLPDGTRRRVRHWAMVGGLHDRPASICHDGNQHGIQLDLTPAGARALLGVPAAALAGQVVSLEDLLGASAPALLERTWGAQRWSARFDQVERALLAQLSARRDDPATTIRPELRWTWRQLVGSGGAVRVEVLADELGWSRRHLSAQFRAEFGLSPRTMSRVARFDAAARRLRSAPATSLAEVAAHAGYADQSHLSREWSRLAGAPPTTWMAEERFPSVHDTDGNEAG